MDLIGSLAGQLGIEGPQAEALAGTVLGGVRSTVGDKLGDEAAGQLDAAVPELGGWQQQAGALLGGGGDGGGGGLGGLLGKVAGGGGKGGLLGAAAGALGGEGAEDVAAIAAVLGKFGIDGGKAALVAPLVLGFLEKRLDPGLLDKILSVAPLLAGAREGGGGLAGKLGGLLG